MFSLRSYARHRDATMGPTAFVTGILVPARGCNRMGRGTVSRRRGAPMCVAADSSLSTVVSIGPSTSGALGRLLGERLGGTGSEVASVHVSERPAAGGTHIIALTDAMLSEDKAASGAKQQQESNASGGDGDGLLELGKSAVDAAIAAKCERVILLSMLGAGTSEVAMPHQVTMSFRPRLLDLTDVEAYLAARARDGGFGRAPTVLRPAPLDDDVDAGAAGRPLVTEDHAKCYGVVSRACVVDAVLSVLASRAADGRTLHVVQDGRLLITSPYVRPREPWETAPFAEFGL